jgi:hypothetical protein
MCTESCWTTLPGPLAVLGDLAVLGEQAIGGPHSQLWSLQSGASGIVLIGTWRRAR